MPGWVGGPWPTEYFGYLPFSEMGVSVLDQLDSCSGPPLDLILLLIVGVIFLRVRNGEVSLLMFDGVGETLLILGLATWH